MTANDTSLAGELIADKGGDLPEPHVRLRFGARLRAETHDGEISPDDQTSITALRQALREARGRAEAAEFQLRCLRDAIGALPGGLSQFERAEQARFGGAAVACSAINYHPAASGSAARERQQWTRDLQQALEREQFEVWLQPQIDLSGATLGYEALLRWRHPEHGLIAPNVFLSFAKESGLIVEIDRWMLRQCCREAVLWRGHLHMAVNVSAPMFRDPGFVETVRVLLEETGLRPRRLELELSESVLADDVDAAGAILRRLKAIGPTLALAHFGAGASSLGCLQTLPFDRMKIDRSFIAGLKRGGKSCAIVRALVELGRGLGLQVIAEGVETRTQLALLREGGCTQFQGLLLGRPASMEETAPLARRPRGARLLGAAHEKAPEPWVPEP